MNENVLPWDEITLEEFGEVVAGGTPSRSNSSYWNGSIPWVTPGEITNLKSKYICETREKITGEGLVSSAAKLLPLGLLLVTTRATLGEVAIAAVPVATNQGFKNIIPNEKTDPVFAYYRIRSLKKEMARLASGTTFLEISKNDFSRIKTCRPPREEQSRIATVLDTVDEAIAKTEAVIAKLKQVRAGLLHDLLTRGLDENGQLRDPIAHPEQFQDSSLGWIPKDWVVEQLKNCYSVPSRNGLYKKANYYGSGYRMVHMPQMFKALTVDISEAARVDVETHELQRYALEDGDILFARRSLNLEGAGLCSLVPRLQEPATFESSIIRVRLNRSKVLPRFTAEFLRSEHGYLLRRPYIRQVAVSGVSSEDVGYFLVPRPTPDEQTQVLAGLQAHDFAADAYDAELTKLRSLKSGLMDVLLTGRVRVPERIAETG